MKFLKHMTSIILLLLVLSCGDSDSSNNTEMAKMSVKLVDEPGDYQNVYIEIIDVKVKYENDNSNDDDDDEGWGSIGVIEPGIYDLLELTGGVSLQLVDNEEIETGTIKQIRLILGDANSVVLEGETEARPLNTPSAQQSGLKVMINQPILAGFNYDFILDFDVDESIVMAGNSGNINLKPVLRASLEVNSGTLAGMVTNTDVAVEVSVDNGQGITASTFIDADGNFEIPGLPAGIYSVIVTPDPDAIPQYQVIIIENVEISVGSVNTLEAITLVE
jgi:hypothetical protein